mmetsp:Transcript_5503/g.24444  ORF Transcript_5503/g.24444 Transcript_5503/m.24444 type:complete len:370 (+) Transcript_5503:884-1993(+)
MRHHVEDGEQVVNAHRELIGEPAPSGDTSGLFILTFLLLARALHLPLLFGCQRRRSRSRRSRRPFRSLSGATRTRRGRSLGGRIGRLSDAGAFVVDGSLVIVLFARLRVVSVVRLVRLSLVEVVHPPINYYVRGALLERREVLRERAVHLVRAVSRHLPLGHLTGRLVDLRVPFPDLLLLVSAQPRLDGFEIDVIRSVLSLRRALLHHDIHLVVDSIPLLLRRLLRLVPDVHALALLVVQEEQPRVPSLTLEHQREATPSPPRQDAAPVFIRVLHPLQRAVYPELRAPLGDLVGVLRSVRADDGPEHHRAELPVDLHPKVRKARERRQQLGLLAVKLPLAAVHHLHEQLPAHRSRSHVHRLLQRRPPRG